MATTPPPPTHIHTPPTPLHGARHDYEPYSPPRRSSRVAGQRRNYSVQQLSIPSSSSASAQKTPTTPTRLSANRTSSQTLSPPSSPSSPRQRSPLRSPKTATRRRVSNTPRKIRPVEVLADSDSEPSNSLASRQSRSLDPRTMLPTPAKTPRKRHVDVASSSTARVLFPSRPATIDDAMPSPKKARKGKKFAGFTLESFAEGNEDEEGSTSNIPIYTDSKERIPSLDEDDENPFVVRKNGKQRAHAATDPIRRRKQDTKTQEMVKAARNDEGIIYVFRGKKIFRRFEDPSHGDAAGEESDELSEVDARRQAGTCSNKRFTRSAIKPRLLFPSEEQQRAREAAAADEADEEAITDIEVPLPKPTGNKRLRTTAPMEADVHDLITPIKLQFHPDTPPSTTRTTRSTVKKDTFETSVAMDVTPELEDDQTELLSVPVTQGKKSSPFDSWRRAKPSRAVSAKGTKREGEPLERPAKRTRSAAYGDGN